jgi:DNA-binding CsgD family transcriptional regulator
MAVTGVRDWNELSALCARGSEAAALRLAVLGCLAETLDFDAACVGTLDPSSGIVTSVVTKGLPAVRAWRFLEPQPPGSVGWSTVRLPLVADGVAWGRMVLLRRPGRAEFTAREAAALTQAGPLLGAALRDAVPGPEWEGELVNRPGTLVVGGDGLATGMTGTARLLLRELAGLDEPSPGVLPTVVSVVAARARERARPTRARVLGLARRYLAVNAEALPGRGPRGNVAVIVEPARPDEVTAAMLHTVPMTPRERSVAALVVQGRSTAEMAMALGISKWTVQDHLKVIFDRLGVRSRRELVSRLRGVER